MVQLREVEGANFSVDYCFFRVLDERLIPVIFLLAALMWSTAFSMYKRKPVGRKLALISAALVLPFLWPVGVYAWWFMHSEGAKRMYKATT